MKKKSDLKEHIPLTGKINITQGATGISNGILQTTTSTSTFILQAQRVLVNTEIVNKDGVLNIELTYEENIPNYFYTNGSPLPKVMIKDIYGSKDGKLEIIKTIRGREIPGYYVPAAIEWDDK